MRKFTPYILIILLLAIYIAGSSSSIMQKVAKEKYETNSFFASDRYRYGDLYGFSYLKDYKVVPEFFPLPPDSSGIPKNINLYMICDSYLWSFVKSDSVFSGVNKLKYARWSYGEKINEQLDTSKKNILIIEVAERFIRQILSNTSEAYNLIYVNKNPLPVNDNPYKTSLLNKAVKYIFRPMTNQSLENNLFDFKFLTPIKEIKAMFNYRIFNRTDIDVSVSKNKEYLFYSATTDTSLLTSSFRPASDEEVAMIISNINDINTHFRNLGFDKVYLSIIPNPVTIIEPAYGKYNELINRIQNSKELKIPLIEIYSVFKNTKYPVYSRSDSHWNSRGFRLWIDETNKVLKKESGY